MIQSSFTEIIKKVLNFINWCTVILTYFFPQSSGNKNLSLQRGIIKKKLGQIHHLVQLVGLLSEHEKHAVGMFVKLDFLYFS